MVTFWSQDLVHACLPAGRTHAQSLCRDSCTCVETQPCQQHAEWQHKTYGERLWSLAHGGRRDGAIQVLQHLNRPLRPSHRPSLIPNPSLDLDLGAVAIMGASPLPATTHTCKRSLSRSTGTRTVPSAGTSSGTRSSLPVCLRHPTTRQLSTRCAASGRKQQRLFGRRGRSRGPGPWPSR